MQLLIWQLREAITRCRLLAEHANGEAAATRLRKLADELEKKVQKLENEAPLR